MGRHYAAVIILLLGLRSNASGYWQQHVRYDIRVTLLDSIHTLEGTESVVYTNHSPDTLHEVWFHLYSNAFQPGSMMDERALAIHSAPIYDRIHTLPSSEWGRYWINTISANGNPVPFDIAGTVMKVALSKPMLPGDSVTIAFPFREQVPKQIRRSGWMSPEGVEYSMAQWYPKIAEYDREGWQRQEYIAREFYGVFGEFNVQITLPSRYTVGATGQCMNPNEVGHGYDEIASGAKAGLSEPTAASGMTTWKFHADHVHDFAWVADDDYIHEWMTWNDTVTIHAFYKQWAKPYWEKNALAYSLFALSTYGHYFGPYAYRNFSCTMAGDGGMEYPQLIMITGYRPNPLSLAGVIAHECGHQWFYGMLGSNETRQAFMDEGFTTFATTLSMNLLFGDHQEYPGEQHSWLDWFVPKFSNKRDNYRFYQEIASQGYEEPLDVPHDWFREDATAGLVYGKTAAILNMLEYTLGDSTFFAGMREYYWEWRFKHPHLLDFERVMEKVSHSDLAWFFDEWFKTTRTVDYAAKSVSSHPLAQAEGRREDSYETTVKLHNNGLAVMPIDLLLHFNDGTSEAATIPLATNQHLDYHKDGISHFFPSWDWVAPNYTGTLLTPKPVSWFEIDTSWRLQDLNWLNNYAGLWFPPVKWALWKQLFIYPPIDEAYAIVRPIVWPDYFSGANLGAGIKFGMNNSFSGDFKLIYKTGYIGPSWDPALTGPPKEPWYDYADGALTLSTPVDWLGRLSSFGFDADKMYGIATLRASISKTFRPVYWRLGATHSATLFVEDQRLETTENYPVWHWGWRTPNFSDAGPLFYPYGTHTDIAGIHYSIVSEYGSTHFDLLGEASVWGSDASFAKAEAVLTNMLPITSGIDLHLRAALGKATNEHTYASASGAPGTPYQDVFFLSRADNYEEQANGFYRAVSSIDYGTSRDASFFLQGGAGVRGYATSSSYEIFGREMAGLNLDLDLPNPIKQVWLLNAFKPGVFADAGWIGGDSLRADAGIELGMKILDLLPGQLRGVAEEYDNIPTVYLDVPLYENLPLDGKPNFAWRWEISLGESF